MCDSNIFRLTGNMTTLFKEKENGKSKSSIQDLRIKIRKVSMNTSYFQ